MSRNNDIFKEFSCFQDLSEENKKDKTFMNTFSPRTFHVEVDVLEYMIFLLGALCSHAVLSDNYLINIFFIFSS